MTIKELKNEIKRLEAENEDFRNYRKNIEGYAELEDKLYKMRNAYWKSSEEKRTQNGNWIREYKKEMLEKQKQNDIELSPELKDWYRNWGSGVDFGYNGTKIVWVSPKEDFVIITSKGGTAGQGTVMGTSGYYYSNTHHMLAYTKTRRRYTEGNSYDKNYDGRLTKELKQKMLDDIDTFIVWLKEKGWYIEEEVKV